MSISPKKITYCIVVGVLTCVFTGRAAPGEEPNQKSSKAQGKSAQTDGRAGGALQSRDQAIAKTRAIIGLLDGTAPQFTAELVTLTEDNTPFLKHQIVGRPIWHVVITNWKLQLKSAPIGVKDSHTRTFDVFVDPKNGRLLKISSRWPEGVPPIAPEPRADIAEEHMVRAGREIYHRFPDAEPSINFLQALDVVFKDGVGDPLIANQIIAHYIVGSSIARQPKPVWAITLRGIPPLPTGYP